MKNLNLKSVLLACMLFLFIKSDAQPPGYHNVKQITILEGQIPDGAILNNFPFLYKITDPDLRTIANGGKVSSSTGDDIIFYLFSCNTKLDHQLEAYDPATGAITAWVRIPVLITTLNTTIYIFYGNDTVSSSSSVNTVWDNTYSGVWHMSNNPAGVAPQILDGTSNGHNGTSNGGMTLANLVPGKMGNALSFDEVNDYIRISDFLYGQELTVSFWFNASEVNGNAYQYLFSHGQWSMPNSLNVYIGEDAITIPAEIPNRKMLKTVFRDSNDANNFDTLDVGNTWIDGNWHYYTVRIQDFGGASVYMDGILKVNYAVWGANTFNPATDIFLGGREDLNAGRFFGGSMDEVRISTVWRSSNWIRTEFNNQNDPPSFFITSSEYSPSGSCGVLPLKLKDFSAIRSGALVKLKWATENYADTAHFIIERSANGIDWYIIDNIVNVYNFIDSFPSKKITFYRVSHKSGTITYVSAIKKVDASCCDQETRIYPNPSTEGKFFIEFNRNIIPEKVLLVNLSGVVLQPASLKDLGDGKWQVNISPNLNKGIYFLKLCYKDGSDIKKLIIQ